MKKILQMLFCFSVFVTGIQLVNAQNFEWAKNIGGASSDYGYSITSDDSGNVYTTGYFHGTADFDPGAGTFNLTSAGSSDIFITKFNATGNLVWAKRMGGTSGDVGRSITTDESANIYTTGSFEGIADFDPGPGTVNLTSAGYGDIFITKFDSWGNLVWAKKMGGARADRGHSITTDTSGNLYSTGYFSVITDFDPGPGTFNLTSVGIQDIFVSKLDASGNFVWAKKMGGAYGDEGFSIKTDASNNIFTTGAFQGTADFDPDTTTFNLSSTGSWDIFISKLDSSGNFVWAMQFGGISTDIGWSLALDGSGNVYTTGYFEGTVDFDPGFGTFNLIPSSGQDIDIFISKLSAAGTFVWAKRLGGIEYDYATSITTDDSGNVYTTGEFSGTADFDPGTGIFYLTSAGHSDVFVSKFDLSGSIVWAKSIGGPNHDYGYSLTTNSSGDVYTTGVFAGTVDFDPSTSIFNLSSVGSQDIFVHKMSSCVHSSSSISPTACLSYTSPSGNYTWTVSGTYLDLIPNAVGCDSSITINLTINTVDTSVSNTSPTLTANATGASYQWLDCNAGMATINGETSQTFTTTANGSYAVAVTQNGCSDTSACIAITNVGLIANSFGEGLVVYPNPTTGNLVVDLGKTYENVEIVLNNAIGQIVLNQQFQDQSLIELDVKGESGNYFLTARAGDRRAVLHVAKQ